MMPTLKEKKMFMLDMDGTIYNENSLIPGAKDFFNLLKGRDIGYTFMTNNSSKGKATYIKKLYDLGIECTEENIASSVNATVNYLNTHKPGARIYLVGTESLSRELQSEGFEVLPHSYRGSNIDYVLVGFDTELNYEKVIGACWYINRGFDYLATNCDLKCPVLDNKFIPDCGAINLMLEAATGRKPLYLGKPDRYLVDFVRKKWNLRYNDIVTVGDRLYTDIAIGINAGVDSICVLTGEATLDDLKTTIYKPTYVFDSIKELYEALI